MFGVSLINSNPAMFQLPVFAFVLCVCVCVGVCVCLLLLLQNFYIS